MNKNLIENELFYCHKVSNSDIEDIRNFKSRDEGKGLENYLKEDAIRDEKDNNMRTYIVRSKKTNDLVAYFSLKAGLISLSYGCIIRKLYTFPGAEIANFSMNETFLNKHPEVKGSGIMIFNSFIQPIIKKVSKIIGLKIIYIFSLPEDKVINNYVKYGFARLDKRDERKLHRKIRPQYDKTCIFMYQLL